MKKVNPWPLSWTPKKNKFKKTASWLFSHINTTFLIQGLKNPQKPAETAKIKSRTARKRTRQVKFTYTFFSRIFNRSNWKRASSWVLCFGWNGRPLGLCQSTTAVIGRSSRRFPEVDKVISVWSFVRTFPANSAAAVFDMFV